MIKFIIFSLFITETIIIIFLLILLLKQRSILHKNQLVELEKWHHMAFTDDLTKIPNRAAYNRHISKIQKSIGKADKTSGIILFDIDNFKKINDTYGHLEGDRTLQLVSSILTNIFCEPNYCVYRIGGDEFAVIAEDITEQDIVDMLLELRHYENTENIYLSKGYSMICSRENIDIAFSRADEMLYADKSSKKQKML